MAPHPLSGFTEILKGDSKKILAVLVAHSGGFMPPSHRTKLAPLPVF